TDDRMRHIIQRDGFAEGRRVSIEAPLPHAMTDDNDGRRRSDLTFILREHASARGFDTERLKHRRREILPVNPFGKSVVSFRAEINGVPEEATHRFKRTISLSPRHVAGKVHSISLLTMVDGRLPNGNETA